MADEDDMLLFVDLLEDEYFTRKKRIFKCRMNPFDDYDDVEFKRRFRFSKQVVNKVHEQVNLVPL